MSIPAYTTRSSHNLNGSDEWFSCLESPSVVDDGIFEWPTVPDYATSTEGRSVLFSSFPSSSTPPVQPVVVPPTDLRTFSTLPDLLATLLNVPKWARDVQLSNEHLQVATTWISNRFQKVSDIPEEEFNRYTDKWRVISSDIRDMGVTVGQVPDPIKVVIHKAIPRPCNSFFFFKRAAIGKLHTGLASQLWKALPRSSVQVWKLAAKRLDKCHKEIFPEYKFRPTHDLNKRKTKKKDRARADDIHGDAIPSGGLKKQSFKTPTAPLRQYSELPQVSNEPTNWSGYDNGYYGHNFELPRGSESGSVAYNYSRDFQPTSFDLLSSFPSQGPSHIFDTGVSSTNVYNTHTGDAIFDEALRREIDGFLWQGS